MKEWSDGNRSVKWFTRGKRVRLEFTDGDVFEIIYTDPVQAEVLLLRFSVWPTHDRFSSEFSQTVIKVLRKKLRVAHYEK